MPKMNRFPKMAALQKFRALRLGYPEDVAEAIGIAEALKYAIFKRLAHTGKRYREAEERKGAKKPLDWDTFKVFELAAYEGKPFVAGRVKSSEDYRRELFYKWGERGNDIERWAEKIIESVPQEYLKDERRFFKEVWVPHRDDPIERS
ncbi:hypothetical protein [Hydrogenivirga sp.]